MEKTQVGEICKVGRGSSPRPISDSKYFEGGDIPWIKIADATKSQKYLYETNEYVNEYGASFSRLLPKGSLIIAASGTLGYTQRLGVKGCIHDGWLYLDEFSDEVNVDFLYYLFKYRVQYFYNSAYGAAIQNVNTTILREMEIALPPLPKQKQIASTLSAFDDLIENNSRRIEILEELARRIYREWFGHFRYPGHEDDELVDSGTDLGEIPKGWEVKKLENIIELNYGKGLRKKDRVEGKYPVYGSSGVIDWHNDYQVEGPGVIVGRKGNVGSMFWEYENFNPIDTTFYVESPLPLTYAFYNLQNQNFINSDAAVPGLSKRQASTLPVLVPDKEILKGFDTKILQLFDLKRVLSEKNEKLKETRDLLLPKLISGKIDVEELSINEKENS